MGEASDVTRVLPWLCVGNIEAASSLEVLKHHGFTHIINLACVPDPFPGEGFNYLSYQIFDNESEQIDSIFAPCCDFIDKGKDDGGQVFVHCQAGRSRSVAVVLAYLVKERMTIDEALSLVQSARKIARPNDGAFPEPCAVDCRAGFLVQLLAWHREVHGKDEGSQRLQDDLKGRGFPVEGKNGNPFRKLLTIYRNSSEPLVSADFDAQHVERSVSMVNVTDDEAVDLIESWLLDTAENSRTTSDLEVAASILAHFITGVRLPHDVELVAACITSGKISGVDVVARTVQRVCDPEVVADLRIDNPLIEERLGTVLFFLTCSGPLAASDPSVTCAKTTHPRLNRQFEALEGRQQQEPVSTLCAWLAEAKGAGVRNHNAACLSTATREGRPSSRMVLIKDVDQHGVVFFTNLQSRKGEELAANPFAAINFYWEGLGEGGRQVRIEGGVTPVAEAEADAYFATRPRGSQEGAWASAQSQPLSSRTELEETTDKVQRRFHGVAVPRPSHWSGFRVSLDRVELWEGRPSRLHHRRVYTMQPDATYTMQLLNP